MFFLISWWLAIIWTHTEVFPRPFDDWKNMVFYVGAGILIICKMVKRVVGGPSAGWFAIQTDRMAGGSWQTKSTGKPRDRTRFIIAIILLYFVIAIVSLILTPTARYEGLLALARLLLWVGAVWIFAQLSLKQWLWLMRLTIISAAIIGLFAYQPAWFGAIIQLFPWHVPFYDAPFLPPIGHMTYYGDFMALSLVMTVGLLFQSRSWVWLIPMGFIDAGLAISATRASLAGIAVAWMMALTIVAYDTRSIRGVATIALIGMLNLGAIFFLPVHSIHGDSALTRLQQATSAATSPTVASLDAASSGRWHTYITSIQISQQRPLLGWGLGSFRFVYPEFAHHLDRDSVVSANRWFYHPHNEVLHQAIDVGWLGAAIWVFGIIYLLYCGIRAFSHAGPEPQLMLITAICGLVAACVSWQFSTNFLFPVSRLITALFAGIIMSFVPHALPLRGRMAAGQERGKCTWAMIAIASLSTLLTLAYQISLVCIQTEQTSVNPRDQQRLAQWAVRLAPGAFDPLYIRATMALQTMPATQAAPDVEALYQRYPYVPAVLQMMGYLRASQGNIPEARKLLQHALANDPSNTAAKQLLDQLPQAH